MQFDGSHYITLVLNAASRKLDVYNSLKTGSKTLAMIEEFAAALYLNAGSVRHRWMSQ